MACNQLKALPFLFLLVACSGGDLAAFDPVRPPIRILAVTADRTVFTPGLGGITVHVTLANDSARPVSVLDCELRYEGAGSGFVARRFPGDTLVPALGTIFLRYTVRLPSDAGETSTIDATARIDDTELGLIHTVARAESPLRITFEPAGGPDLSHLPALVVTTYGDELDGGADVSSIEAAGGLDDLSTREAITLVNNWRVPHAITFDPELFDPSVAQVLLLNASLPDLEVGGTAIDGFGRLVRFRASGVHVATVQAPNVTWRSVAADNGLVATGADGLTLVDTEFSRSANGFSGVLISRSSRVTIQRSSLQGTNGLSCEQCDDLSVEDSILSGALVVSNSTGVVVRDTSVFKASLSGTPDARIERVRTETLGLPMEIGVGCDGTLISDSTLVTQNVSAEEVVTIAESQRVTITRTRMIRSTNYDTPSALILLLGLANANLAAPSLSWSAGLLSGTTSALDGSRVEIFSAVGYGLDRYEGDATVMGGAFSFSPATLEPGRNLAATVTDPAGNTSPAGIVVVP